METPQFKAQFRFGFILLWIGQVLLLLSVCKKLRLWIVGYITWKGLCIQWWRRFWCIQCLCPIVRPFWLKKTVRRRRLWSCFDLWWDRDFVVLIRPVIPWCLKPTADMCWFYSSDCNKNPESPLFKQICGLKAIQKRTNGQAGFVEAANAYECSVNSLTGHSWSHSTTRCHRSLAWNVWLIDWLIDWWMDGWMDGWMDCLIVWLIDWLIDNLGTDRHGFEVLLLWILLT